MILFNIVPQTFPGYGKKNKESQFCDYSYAPLQWLPNQRISGSQEWYDRHPECEYLLSTPDGKHFLYRNYKDSNYTTIMEQIGIK